MVTLHTVLDSPTSEQRIVMQSLVRRAAKLVVMSKRAIQMLAEVYGVDKQKIAMIHHGAPEATEALSPTLEEPCLMTFGLLSPDKGIEHVIRAMPDILRRSPKTRYLIVGATHPQVKAQQGEAYRRGLHSLVDELEIGHAVEFVDRFLTHGELIDYLRRADIYVTPYTRREQITSGTLAYALTAGKAIVSTPYWYAEEILAEGRGILIPWENSEATAEAISDLICNDERRIEIQQRALAFGRSMHWPAVGAKYHTILDKIEVPQPRPVRRIRDMTPMIKETIPELSLIHLRRMTDDTGLMQHAYFSVPRYSEGYCLDDNCRALLLTGLIVEANDLPPIGLADLACTYLAFVAYALSPQTGKFRNFFSYESKWVEQEGSEDSQGRALWCLAGFAARCSQRSHRECAMKLFGETVSSMESWLSPRSLAFGLLGIEQLFGREEFTSNLQLLAETGAERLSNSRKEHYRRDWPWFEPYLSYCNATLASGYLAASRILGLRQMQDDAIESLDWLWNIQDGGTFFDPIGCDQVYQRDGERPEFDQQPVEVGSMISACLAAFRATRDEIWRNRAWKCFDWFFGENRLGIPLCDQQTGACYDGLQPSSVNLNQGAESTLAYLTACEEMKLAGIHQPIAKLDPATVRLM
ncbi:MAG: glycosyltransferase [Armatimonadetes bacterium]|nr:glycosyltransferase [Armatimonadota bacterium]